MPNRMLRDWTGSDKVNAVSVHAERFFIRLIMKADDYGCFFAEARLLRPCLFPLLIDTIREADMLRWMAECQKAVLIVLYEHAGKKYLQIQDFRQRLDKARSKYPLPNPTEFPEIVNEVPAEVEVEVERNKKRKNTGAPSAPRAPKEEGESEKKRFVPPSLDQVKTYFLSTIGDTRKAKHWPEDKCHNEAGQFIDHYRANGWVQGRGKPIKDWQASCRNWIRHGLQGVFDRPTAKAVNASPSVQQAVQAIPSLTKQQIELNYLFERFLEEENSVSTHSISSEHYNLLKASKLLTFTADESESIKKMALDYILEKKIEKDGEVELRFKKKFAVLLFFKQLKAKGQGAIFYLVNPAHEAV